MLKDGSAAVAGIRRSTESLDITNTVARFDRLIARADQMLAGKDNDLTITLDNLRALTANLRELSEHLKQNPASLLLSEPPKRSRTLP